MAAYMYTLPFRIPNIYGGFGQVKGLLKVDKESLSFDFQSEDAILGLLKSQPRVERIPMREVESAEVKTSLFSRKLILRFYKLETLEAFPQVSGDKRAGELQLRVKRGDKERALKIESYVNLRISEIRLDSFDQDDMYS